MVQIGRCASQNTPLYSTWFGHSYHRNNYMRANYRYIWFIHVIILRK